MPIERKLAAIMFTDIAGYTALSAKDSTKASELLKTQRDTLKPIVEKHGGSWMKEMGDGLLLTFDSATSAVECSIAIQEATKDIEDLNLRIGIHEGEVIKQDGDVIGDDVNVASRIEPFSAIGGVAISDKIYRAISSNQEFETKYIGKPKLKGVSQEVKVYCITSHGLPETDVSKVSAKLEEESKFNIFALTGAILTAIGIAFWIAVGVFDVSFGGKTEVPSIAIIPFDNKGVDEDAFYAYSISSELISDIASAGLIRVAGLKDIESLEYQTMKYNELSEKLLVRYIAHGSIWKKDSVFQLSMELYDTKTSKVLWSDNWQQKWDELASITGSLAKNILKTLKVSTKQDISNTPTFRTDAYEYYLKGKYKYNKRENMEDMEIARGLLTKAIELDENLSIAKNLLGITYDVMGNYDKAMEIYLENLKKAEDTGDMVIIGSSLINIGNIKKFKKGGYEIALDNYTRALNIFEEIGDKYRMGIALSNIGSIHYSKFDYELALNYSTQALEIAEELDDKHLIAAFLNDMAGIYNYKDEYDKALDYMERALKINEEIGNKQGIGKSLSGIGYIYFDIGDYEKSLDYHDRSLTLFEELGDKSRMASNLAKIGNTFSAMRNYDKALEYYNRSLNLQEELGNERLVGHRLYNIGDTYWNKGDFNKSLYYYKRSMKIAETIDDKRHIQSAVFAIGWTYYEMGDYDQALDYYYLHIKIYEELGWKDISYTINNIGLAYFQKHNYNKALEFFDKAVTMQMEFGRPITLETLSHLFLTKRILGIEYIVSEIYKLIMEQEEIEDYINFALFKLLEDTSYLETAFNQVQEKADNLEPDVAAKFLSYPIPKAIVEEWE